MFKKALILTAIAINLMGFDPIKDLNKLNIISDMYEGNEFLTKEEFIKVKTEMEKIKAANSSPKAYVFLLTSSSVPKAHLENLLIDVGILQENGVKIETKQYFQGFPSNLEGYINSIRASAEKMPEKQKNSVVSNFSFKLGPDFFEDLNITKVPALVFSVCNPGIPKTETCLSKYIMRGDVSLPYFFNEIAEKEENKTFKKMFEILKANQIVEVNDND